LTLEELKNPQIGYAQPTSLELDSLETAGCELKKRCRR
jgi:hypothetical protein